jgi:hypothetical protein
VGGGDVEAKLFYKAGKARSLPLGKLEDEARERGGVDDRVFERTLQAATDQPRVEGVVAVLDQHCTLCETQECPPRVTELGRADEHRALDVVAAARVGVDGSAAVDERVEERQRAGKREPLSPDLEDEEGGVACRLDVEGDELRFIEARSRADLRRVDRDLLPRHRICGAAGFEENRPGHLANAVTWPTLMLSAQTRSHRT